MNDENQKEKRKNVIWIFGDQHRAQALSIHNDPNVNTPNIDNLAVSGVDFPNAIAGYPLCCPARGSILTSKYPHKCVPGHEHQLPQDQPTIAHVFNENGYDTAYFGKWHLDGFQEKEGRAAKHYIPIERRGGFKKWLGYENNNSQWDCWVHGKVNEEVEPYRLPGYETDELTNLFIQYIQDKGKEKQNEKGSPFFAVLSVQPPHDPYIAPEEFRQGHSPSHISLRSNVPSVPRIEEKARQDLSGYYAMIENLDWNLGRIQAALQECDLSFDTHIVFFSDHGDLHGSQGQFKKTSPYEEAIRVPFIIGGEQSFYDGRKTGASSVLLNHVDIAPTTLGLCDIEKPEWMDGKDYSPYRLQNNKEQIEPDSAYIQSVIPTGHGDSVDKPWRGIVTKDGWKYVCFEKITWLMFNLNEDPFEQVNLAHNTLYFKKRKELNDRLKLWIEDTEDVFILPIYDE
ncbi:sulfatase [Bacillus sp. J14TS2]|uniref:sulfatase family protein n=1 Tax=Bacillus sp. J14TS2 TaxID=2807188 RepID=UPI001B2E74EA|nr:sulfatase [Bacillus sp. J14TS2]GIN71574.1 sulfatase [Bacillus sp. J14TS2]